MLLATTFCSFSRKFSPLWTWNTRRNWPALTGVLLHNASAPLAKGQPPGVGKNHLCQAIGYAVIESEFSVLYRSIFDLVRDFLHDEGFEGEDIVTSSVVIDVNQSSQSSNVGEGMRNDFCDTHDLVYTGRQPDSSSSRKLTNGQERQPVTAEWDVNGAKQVASLSVSRYNGPHRASPMGEAEPKGKSRLI